MTKTATTMRWTMVALLAGALTLPGLALARDHDGDWDGHGHGYGHWKHYRHGPGWGGREVVVVRRPVYVEPRRVYVEPRAVVTAPVLQPPGLGVNLYLPLQGW